jgi:semaphorin 6
MALCNVLELYYCMQQFNLMLCHKVDNLNVSGPEVSAADSPLPQFSGETMAAIVVSSAVAALVIGFVFGYFCGRKCHKEEEDNLPYPDTEYEYFEQRQTVNRQDICYSFS